MGQVVIVDTSVFLNILDVPGKNQDRDATLDAFEEHIDAGDHLYLPLPCIIETGNHVAQLSNGHERYKFAALFEQQVLKAINGDAPWQPVPLLSEANDDLRRWLADFPNEAISQVSMTDVTVKHLYAEFCRKFGMSTVRVWSLDRHLASLHRPTS